MNRGGWKGGWWEWVKEVGGGEWVCLQMHMCPDILVGGQRITLRSQFFLLPCDIQDWTQIVRPMVLAPYLLTHLTDPMPDFLLLGYSKLGTLKPG